MKTAFTAVLTLALLVIGSSARAYNYKFEFSGDCVDNAGKPYKMNMELHTVSSVCHNVQKWGFEMTGSPIFSSASICLVDRIWAKDNQGTVYTWSGGIGSGNTTFYVACNAPLSSAFPTGIHYCGMGTNATCTVRYE